MIFAFNINFVISAAETPCYFALLPEYYNGPKGELWRELKIMNCLDLNYKWEDNQDNMAYSLFL